MDAYYKIPRLYLNSSFSESAVLEIHDDHVHYLKNVLRRGAGDTVRVFNGVDGEWLAQIENLKKKSGILCLQSCIRAQDINDYKLTLYFAPIQKTRMFVLIEKAVELGVHTFVPVLTNRTEHRKINEGRINAHIVEAAEQCERLDVPTLQNVRCFNECLTEDLFVCLERSEETQPISNYDFSKGGAFMIGPVGGFDDDERALLKNKENVKLISLGQRVLRCETAALAALSYAMLSRL